MRSVTDAGTERLRGESGRDGWLTSWKLSPFRGSTKEMGFTMSFSIFMIRATSQPITFRPRFGTEQSPACGELAENWLR